jgi:prepilin-type processing-associated H-X9-DG protein
MGPATDYAGAFHGGINEGALNNMFLNGVKAAPDAPSLQTCLDDPAGRGKLGLGPTIGAVTNGSGTSNTALLGHKALQPGNYSRVVDGGSNNLTTGGLSCGNFCSNDDGWVWTYWPDPNPNGSWFDHMRWLDWGAAGANRGMGYAQDVNGMDENHMGGPHPGGSPILWADGSVRGYSYGYADSSLIAQAKATGGDATQTANAPGCAMFQIMWAYNRSEVVTPP